MSCHVMSSHQKKLRNSPCITALMVVPEAAVAMAMKALRLLQFQRSRVQKK